MGALFESRAHVECVLLELLKLEMQSISIERNPGVGEREQDGRKGK